MEVYVLRADGLWLARLAVEVSSGRARPRGWDEVRRVVEELIESEPCAGDGNCCDVIVWLAKYPQTLEHVYVTLLLVDVPTFVMWQLTRHRHISWMVSSHRHSLVPPDPAIPDSDRIDSRLEEAIRFMWAHGYKFYKQLLSEGYPAELARLVLPPVDSRVILASANLRAWLEMLCFRLNANTQPETRRLVEKILSALDKRYPGLERCFDQVCNNLYKYRVKRRAAVRG